MTRPGGPAEPPGPSVGDMTEGQRIADDWATTWNHHYYQAADLREWPGAKCRDSGDDLARRIDATLAEREAMARDHLERNTRVAQGQFDRASMVLAMTTERVLPAVEQIARERDALRTLVAQLVAALREIADAATVRLGEPNWLPLMKARDALAVAAPYLP